MSSLRKGLFGDLANLHKMS